MAYQSLSVIRQNAKNGLDGGLKGGKASGGNGISANQRCGLWKCKMEQERGKKDSIAGNRTPISCVKDRYDSRYTTMDDLGKPLNFMLY